MEGDIGKVEEVVKSLLSGLTSEQRVTMIQSIQSILNSELIRTNYEIPDMTCPVCGSTECIRYGTTRIGTPRWQCKACHHVRCHIETGRILANSKLTKDQWMRYAECFVDHIPSKLVAQRIGVCTKTAWFMRLRTLEAIYNNLPSFQVKDGCGVEIDELYFRESFKGTRFDSMDYTPREPRKSPQHETKSGISNDQICVVTALNDAGDFFYDVTCRGGLTSDIAQKTLGSRIESGAIVNTDKHRAYPKVMKELSVAVHNRISSKDHAATPRLDNVHGDIRSFMSPFKGVSTRWLHLYLAWYKWLKCFAYNAVVAAKHIVGGDYIHRWNDIKTLGSPFRTSDMQETKC